MRPNTEKVGVLYAPFQMPCLTPGGMHYRVMETMFKAHATVCVVLPVKRFPASAVSPLGFAMRQQMIQKVFPSAIVLPLVDQKYPENVVKELEGLIASAIPIQNHNSIRLYADTDFNTLYRNNGGVWEYDSPFQGNSFLSVEGLLRNDVESFVPNDDTNEVFRRGVIYGLSRLYPVSWMAVDIAITRMMEGREQLLLGKKPGEKGWRFPGGFKDRADNGLEPAVYRETKEEVSIQDLTAAQYIGSRNVDDWRYRGEKDGITTAFFQTEYYGTEDIRAGDDLAEVRWFEMSELDTEMMEGEHSVLLEMFMGIQ